MPNQHGKRLLQQQSAISISAQEETQQPIPVAARSKAWVCGLSLAAIVISIPAGVIDVYLLLMLCVVRKTSLRRADPLSRRVVPSMCVSACDQVQQ